MRKQFGRVVAWIGMICSSGVYAGMCDVNDAAHLTCAVGQSCQEFGSSAACLPLLTRWTGSSCSISNTNPAGTDVAAQRHAVDLYDYNYDCSDPNKGYSTVEAWNAVDANVFQLGGNKIRVTPVYTNLIANYDGIQVLTNYYVSTSGIDGKGRTYTDSPMLATFILPRGWDPDRAQKYPIVLTANGYTVQNNSRVFRDYGYTDVLAIAAQSTANGGTGAIVAVVNAGGMESVGLNDAAIKNVWTVLSAAHSGLGGDLNQVITYGGSRGGMTALVYGANPGNYAYKVRAIFAKVPFPKLGTACSIPMSAVGAFANTYNIVFDPALGGSYLGYKYVENSLFDIVEGQTRLNDTVANEICRIVTGFGVVSEANARSGHGQINRYRALAADSAYPLKRIVLSAGSKDAFFPYWTFHEFYKNLTAQNIPVTAYVGLGAGHEGVGSWGEPDKDLIAYLQGGDLDNEATLPPVGITYLKKMDRRGQPGEPKPAPEFTAITVPSTPFSARVSYREQVGWAGPSGYIEGYVEAVGATGMPFSIKLCADASCVNIVQSWSGVFSASETAYTRFMIPDTIGTYYWELKANNTRVECTPRKLPDGSEPPLTLTVAAEQPSINATTNDYLFARVMNDSEAFGVDEYVCD